MFTESLTKLVSFIEKNTDLETKHQLNAIKKLKGPNIIKNDKKEARGFYKAIKKHLKHYFENEAPESINFLEKSEVSFGKKGLYVNLSEVYKKLSPEKYGEFENVIYDCIFECIVNSLRSDMSDDLMVKIRRKLEEQNPENKPIISLTEMFSFTRDAVNKYSQSLNGKLTPKENIRIILKKIHDDEEFLDKITDMKDQISNIDGNVLGSKFDINKMMETFGIDSKDIEKIKGMKNKFPEMVNEISKIDPSIKSEIDKYHAS